MQVNSPPAQIKSDQKCLQKLRLQTAQEILCNLDGQPVLPNNQSHISELSDDYAIRILLNWLALKNDFPAYKRNISSTSNQPHYIFDSWNCLSNDYPLNRDSHVKAMDMAYRKGFELLERSLLPGLHSLGNLYELINHTKLIVTNINTFHIESRSKRSLSGQFYTPPWVVNYCYHAVQDKYLLGLIKPTQQTSFDNYSNKTQPRIKIIDPSCGSGNFLLGALEWFQEYKPTYEQQFDFVCNSLFGNDIDGRAISLCRLGLVIKLAPYFNSLLLSNDSSTADRQMNTLIKSLQANIQISDSIVSGANQNLNEFDLVATNPPYISYGSRNQAKTSPTLVALLKRQYPNSSEYKIRLHSIFQDICLRLSKENGKIVLLLPDAFLNGRHYVKLRKHLIRSAEIESLTELPEQIIPSATVGRWCIPVYRKSRTVSKNYNVNLHSFDKSAVIAAQVSTMNSPAPNKSFQVSTNILISHDHSRFRMIFSDIDANICQIIDSLAPVENYLSGHTGIRSKIGQAAVISKKQESSNHRRGLSSGSSVTRYKIRWDDIWINTNKEILYAGGFDEQLMSRPKILMRQTGDRVISALDVSGLYHLNNIHSFCCSEDFVDLDYLTGIMNSSCWLYLYQLKSRESDRVLAQIDIEMIESMPLPPHNDDLIKKISCLSKSLRLPEAAHKLQSITNRAIDHLTYLAYGFSKDQIDHIESFCQTKLPFPDKLPHAKDIDSLLSALSSE